MNNSKFNSQIEKIRSVIGVFQYIDFSTLTDSILNTWNDSIDYSIEKCLLTIRSDTEKFNVVFDKYIADAKIHSCIQTTIYKTSLKDLRFSVKLNELFTLMSLKKSIQIEKLSRTPQIDIYHF